MIESAKKVELADLPYKMNLQLFNEGETGEVAEPQTDVAEPNISGDEPEVEGDGTTSQEQDEGHDIGHDLGHDPNQKPVQDNETNRAFAEMRRKAESYEAKAKKIDSMIAAQYGESHGIYTLEEYENALQKQAEEEEKQRMIDAGFDPEYINKAIENHPVVQKAREDAFNKMLLDSYNEVAVEYPELIKQPEDIAEEVWKKWNKGESGLSLLEAYTIVNRKSIYGRAKQIGAQKTLNSINSKSHLTPETPEGTDIDTTTIPDETLRIYQALNPNKSMKDYLKHYKQNM